MKHNRLITLLLILAIAGMATGCSGQSEQEDRWNDKSIFKDDPSKHKKSTRQL